MAKSKSSVILQRTPTRRERLIAFLSNEAFWRRITYILVGLTYAGFAYLANRAIELGRASDSQGVMLVNLFIALFVATLVLTYTWYARLHFMRRDTTDLMANANTANTPSAKRELVSELRANLQETVLRKAFERRQQQRDNGQEITPIYWSFVSRRRTHDLGIIYDALEAAQDKLNKAAAGASLADLGQLFELQQIDPKGDLAENLLYRTHPVLFWSFMTGCVSLTTFVPLSFMAWALFDMF